MQPQASRAWRRREGGSCHTNILVLCPTHTWISSLESGGSLHNTLLANTLDLASPVGCLGVDGHGKTLEGMRLEAAGKAAQGLDDGELAAVGDAGGSAEGSAGSDCGRHFGCVVVFVFVYVGSKELLVRCDAVSLNVGKEDVMFMCCLYLRDKETQKMTCSWS